MLGGSNKNLRSFAPLLNIRGRAVVDDFKINKKILKRYRARRRVEKSEYEGLTYISRCYFTYYIIIFYHAEDKTVKKNK